MSVYETLVDYIDGLTIIDTHEHLPLERDLPRQGDVLSEWLSHYFSCDLVSAGLTEAELAQARETSRPLPERWALVAPYWHAAQSTGYGRALALAARDLFGVAEITGDTIAGLSEAMMARRTQPDYYRWLLGEQCRLAVSIRDSKPEADADLDGPDPFVFTLHTGPFMMPGHYRQVCALGEAVDMPVHTLADWEAVTRAHLERYLRPGSRVVCLKSSLAYWRSLRFEKVPYAEAEHDFHALFADEHLPTWRGSIRMGRAFQDYMQHAICRIADEHGMVYQFHTGLQEGHGNFITDSNPALLANLFLEYGNVTFDLFHMGYPYMGELGALAKNFRNVTIDMCWGHIISPEAARRALVEWLDAVPANKISAFGGDYCFPEGVYGHQYLARRNVAAALTQKVQDDTFDLDRAQEIAHRLFIDNPRRIFRLHQKREEIM
jgi:hypothetical protein